MSCYKLNVALVVSCLNFMHKSTIRTLSGWIEAIKRNQNIISCPQMETKRVSFYGIQRDHARWQFWNTPWRHSAKSKRRLQSDAVSRDRAIPGCGLHVIKRWHLPPHPLMFLSSLMTLCLWVMVSLLGRSWLGFLYQGFVCVLGQKMSGKKTRLDPKSLGICEDHERLCG